jgi:hypothetical protein
MPTYTINGRTVRTTKPLTDDEIDEIAATLPTQAGVTPKELSKVFQRNRPQDTGVTPGQYLTDVAKGSVARFVPQIMRAVAGMEAPLQTPSAEPSLTQEIEKQFISPVEQRTQQAVGYQQLPAPSKPLRVVAGGIESALDPLSIVSGGGGIVPRVLGGFLPGMTAEFGGQVGQNIAGDPGQFVGALTGGITGGVAQGSIPRTTGTLLPQARSLTERVRGMRPEADVLREADSTVTNILQAAAQADPNIAQTLSRAQQVSGTTGVTLPATALLDSNPVLVDLVRNLSSRDPVFRNQYGQQFEQARNALQGRATRLFGQPGDANAIIQQTVRDIPLDKVQQRRLDALNKQIAKESSFNVEDQQQLGSRLATLVATKEDEAKKAVAPLYQRAFDYAEQNNVGLPAAGVEDIFQFATDQRSADVFKTFPSIWSKINTQFKPTLSEPSALLNERGLPLVPGGEQVFKAATIEDLDSLKREINRQLRTTRDEASVRLLNELKSKVNGVINTLPEGFVTQYKAADAAYLNQVGLPFNTEAIKQVDRAKFDESVLPVLTKNKSALSQFLDVTGNEGSDLAMKAFLLDFDKTAVKNGVIDVNAARKWLKANNAELSLLGDKADTIRNAVDNVTTLNAEKVRINNAFTEAKKNKLLQLEGKTAQEIVGSLYSKPANVDQFLRTYGSNVDTLNAVRSFMLDDILSAADPVAALADRTRKATYDKVFGPTYIKNVESLAEASRRLANNPADVKFNVQEVPTTPIEQLIGVPPEEILSKFRNPIASSTWAISSILSKFWAKQTAAATDERLKALLLDPQATNLLAKALTPKDNGTLDLQAANKFLKAAQKFGINWADMLVNDAATGAIRATPAIQANMPEEMQ